MSSSDRVTSRVLRLLRAILRSPPGRFRTPLLRWVAPNLTPVFSVPEQMDHRCGEVRHKIDVHFFEKRWLGRCPSIEGREFRRHATILTLWPPMEHLQELPRIIDDFRALMWTMVVTKFSRPDYSRRSLDLRTKMKTGNIVRYSR